MNRKKNTRHLFPWTFRVCFELVSESQYCHFLGPLDVAPLSDSDIHPGIGIRLFSTPSGSQYWSNFLLPHHRTATVLDLFLFRMYKITMAMQHNCCRLTSTFVVWLEHFIRTIRKKHVLDFDIQKKNIWWRRQNLQIFHKLKLQTILLIDDPLLEKITWDFII